MNRALRAVLIGGLVVGTLDALDAFAFFGIRSGATPDRIFRGIAAGWLGPAAREGGAGVVAIGVLSHYFIATMIVAVCVLLARRVPIMIEKPFVFGPLYGLIVYGMMNYVVIPLSSARQGSFVWPVFLNGIGIHMLGVGIPSVLAARAALRDSMSR